MSDQARRVPHVNEVAICGDSVLVRGRAAYVLARILGCYGGGLSRLLSAIGASHEQRDSALRAFAALEEIGDAWLRAETSSVRENSKTAREAGGSHSQRWITTSEAAGLLGLTTTRVAQLARARVLPAERLGGRWWIERAAVIELRERREAA